MARRWLHAALWCAAGCGSAHAQQPAPRLNPPPVFVSEVPAESQRYDVAPAGFTAPPARSENVDAIDLAQTLAVVPGASGAQADPQLSQAELYDRLLKTEDRLKELEKHGAPRTDPKTHTMLNSLRERWDKTQDPSIATVDQQTHKPKEDKPKEKKWYDRLSIRGYAQFRLNEIVDQSGTAPAQYVGDRSIGEDQGFLIRRARLIISGDVSDHLYVYIQPDFASTPNGATDQIYFGQIRDWYGDVYLDQCKVHRLLSFDRRSRSRGALDYSPGVYR